mgnify:CR=1 FL=1
MNWWNSRSNFRLVFTNQWGAKGKTIFIQFENDVTWHKRKPIANLVSLVNLICWRKLSTVILKLLLFIFLLVNSLLIYLFLPQGYFDAGCWVRQSETSKIQGDKNEPKRSRLVDESYSDSSDSDDDTASVEGPQGNEFLHVSEVDFSIFPWA